MCIHLIQIKRRKLIAAIAPTTEFITQEISNDSSDFVSDEDEEKAPPAKVPQRGKDGKAQRHLAASKDKDFYDEPGAPTTSQLEMEMSENQLKKNVELHMASSDIRLKNIEEKYQEMAIAFSK